MNFVAIALWCIVVKIEEWVAESMQRLKCVASA